MDTMMNIANNVHGGILTVILVFVVIFDTALALKIRLPKGLFLSKRMLMGAMYNLSISMIPLLCDILTRSSLVCDVDVLVIRVVMLAFFVAILMGVLGSCVANYSIAYPRAKVALQLSEKFFPKELQQKIDALGGEDDGGKSDK